MENVYCEKCKLATVNEWGNTECWLFEDSPNSEITSLAAGTRERHAMFLNRDNDCNHYQPKSLLKRLLRK